MSYDGAHRREELFHDLCDRPIAERRRLLAAACPGDLKLRAEVESLLEADDGSSNALNTPAWAALRAADPSTGPRHTIHAGQRIDRYEIVRLIGSGGMGSVYEAVQDNPHRTVALKIMRTSVSGEQALRRFRYEAELLGRLRHAGIAQIFDAGMFDDDGLRVAYFAMEYVPSAATLPEYAQSHRLDTHQRLALFAQVCDAVQHGHERGVVHRDLKPGNILVDASGSPKVIDFGVARATHLETPLTTIQTSVGQLVGTLAYMSPEQAGGDPDAVDVRSDVYSLGVVLYELLAGRRLFDLTGKPLLQAVRAICEGRPPALRSIDRSFRGDLDAIVAKALEPDKQRRYASASAFADDVRRYLTHQPVWARPPSALYQLGKFARRNKALVGGCLVALFGLIIGAATATWKAIEATTQRDRAQREARRAERVTSVLKTIFTAADPRAAPADLTIRDALDRASGQIERELAADPDVRAEVYAILGGIYVRLQRRAEGRVHLRKALDLYLGLYGERHCVVADTMSDLAWAIDEDRKPEAEDLFSRALAIKVSLYGDDSAAAAAARVCLASAKRWRGDQASALALCRQAIPALRRELGPNHPEVAYALSVMGDCQFHSGAREEGISTYRQALETQTAAKGPDDLQRATMLRYLAGLLDQVARPQEAAPIRAEADRINVLLLGATIPRVVGSSPNTQPPVASSPTPMQP